MWCKDTPIQNRMGKVCPETSVSSSYITSERETFTIWMKSLVFHSNGCSVFNSKGELVFRVDNYQERCGTEVYLMDLSGEVLFSIERKTLRIFGSWKIYKWSDVSGDREVPWFQVRRRFKVFGRRMSCHVSVGWDKTKRSCYKIVELKEKSTIQIIDSGGRLVAEVKRKQSASGVPLGDDVLSLVVEPQRDYSLIMALVTVKGLIDCQL